MGKNNKTVGRQFPLSYAITRVVPNVNFVISRNHFFVLQVGHLIFPSPYFWKSSLKHYSLPIVLRGHVYRKMAAEEIKRRVYLQVSGNFF